MTAKELLLHITSLAYNGDEMSLLSDVHPWKFVPPDKMARDPERDLTDEVAHAKPDIWYRSIADILKHVAACKAGYLEQAFGPPPEPYPPSGDTLESLLAYVDAVQRRTVACIEQLADEALPKPVRTDFHGESAAHLFWVLAQHDVAHGSQIGVLRDALEA